MVCLRMQYVQDPVGHGFLVGMEWLPITSVGRNCLVHPTFQLRLLGSLNHVFALRSYPFVDVRRENLLRLSMMSHHTWLVFSGMLLDGRYHHGDISAKALHDRAGGFSPSR